MEIFTIYITQVIFSFVTFILVLTSYVFRGRNDTALRFGMYSSFLSFVALMFVAFDEFDGFVLSYIGFLIYYYVFYFVVRAVYNLYDVRNKKLEIFVRYSGLLYGLVILIFFAYDIYFIREAIFSLIGLLAGLIVMLMFHRQGKRMANLIYSNALLLVFSSFIRVIYLLQAGLSLNMSNITDFDFILYILGVFSVLFTVVAIIVERGLLDYKNLMATKDIVEDSYKLAKKASETDELTGLFNRRKIIETLNSFVESKRVSEKQFAVALLDINKFKQINDTLGHSIGDQVLIHTANLLKEAVRSSDVIARWGGDEFVIIFRDVNEDSLSSTINKIIETFKSDKHESLPKISISIGAQVYKEGISVENLLHMADKKMYEHKSTK